MALLRSLLVTWPFLPSLLLLYCLLFYTVTLLTLNYVLCDRRVGLSGKRKSDPWRPEEHWQVFHLFHRCLWPRQTLQQDYSSFEGGREVNKGVLSDLSDLLWFFIDPGVTNLIWVTLEREKTLVGNMTPKVPVFIAPSRLGRQGPMKVQIHSAFVWFHGHQKVWGRDALLDLRKDPLVINEIPLHTPPFLSLGLQWRLQENDALNSFHGGQQAVQWEVGAARGCNPNKIPVHTFGHLTGNLLVRRRKELYVAMVSPLCIPWCALKGCDLLWTETPYAFLHSREEYVVQLLWYRKRHSSTMGRVPVYTTHRMLPSFAQRILMHARGMSCEQSHCSDTRLSKLARMVCIATDRTLCWGCWSVVTCLLLCQGKSLASFDVTAYLAGQGNEELTDHWLDSCVYPLPASTFLPVEPIAAVLL